MCPAADALTVYDAVRRRRRARTASPGRAQVAGLAADGEGLPRLRPRHRQHRRPAGGRARVRASPWTSRRFIGRDAVLARKRQRRGRPDAPARAGAAARPRAAAVPRRARSAATAARRLHAGGVVRLDARLGRRPGHGRRRASRSPPTGWRPATWEVDVAGTSYAAEVSLRPMYDPTQTPASRVSSAYFGGIRMPPSTRMVSPFM